MYFAERLCDLSNSVQENCDKSMISKPAPTSMESFNTSSKYPSLWPSLPYSECVSDTDKEIWITMFDEETTMELFPIPTATPQSPLLMKQNSYIFHTLINDSTTFNPDQTVKIKTSDDRNDNQNDIHTFKNFKWQSIQSENCQPIQESVRRRLDL